MGKERTTRERPACPDALSPITSAHVVAGFIQRFRPYAKGEFKLIGQPMVVIGGQIISENEAAPFIAQLRRGILSHEKAAELWPSWTTP